MVREVPTIQIGVCDDNKEFLTKIKELLLPIINKYLSDRAEIYTYNDSSVFLEALSQISFDLVFLDIEMPGPNGFDVAAHLSLYHKDAHLVFVSEYEGYVFDSLDYTPLWFVRKSKMERDLVKVFQKYEQMMIRYQVSYRLKDEGFGVKEILIKYILYFEGEKHNVTLYTSERRYIQYGSLKGIEQQLGQHGFIRIHRNYLVNARYIQDVGSKDITLLDGKKLELGKDRRMAVREAILKYERSRH